MATKTKTRKNARTNLPAGLREVERMLWVTKEQLIRLNQESIEKRYNRTLKPGVISRLPDQRYPVPVAFRHVGFNGRRFNNLNYRLVVLLAVGGDWTCLDITPESWAKVKEQKIAA